MNAITLEKSAFTKATDEAAIRALIAAQHDAICTRDLDRVMAPYAEDVVLFDVRPPFRIEGVDAFRAQWAECLPSFPDGLRVEVRDLKVEVSGDLAAANWVQRFVSDQPGREQMEIFIRASSIMRRENGAWTIVHEHASVPFDPLSGEAVLVRSL